MKKANRNFHVKKRKVVFSKGPIHLVDCEVKIPSGKVLSRQILEHPGSVVILPKVARQRYVLIRQFRFAARGWLWEIPAGGVEPKESLRKAASRELCEEIGFKPGKLTRLLQFYPSPGISSEVMHLYLAEELRPQTAPQDEDEEIEVRVFSVKEVFEMIRRGRVIDAKTILAFSYLRETGNL